MADKTDQFDSLLERLPVSRRNFISRVAAGTFVAPVVSSAALTGILASSRDASAQFLACPPFSSPPPFFTTPGPSTVDLPASADSYLRSDSVNTNEGANPRLRVGVDPVSRAVIQFDPAAFAGLTGAASVQLLVTIATNHNTWGQCHPRSIVAHPLKTTFVEGNGHQGLLPESLAQRGTGSGVTWRSPNDPDVANNKVDPRHHPALWNGGKFGPATAPPVLHENMQSGVVSFDVTADVQAGATGWLLKVDDERADDDDDGDDRLPAGDEPRRGVVEYYSIQGAADVDTSLTPVLRFFF